jgi:hypothetical protein
MHFQLKVYNSEGNSEGFIHPWGILPLQILSNTVEMSQKNDYAHWRIRRVGVVLVLGSRQTKI